VGFGGYASLPAALAATHLGLPTLIHEQNAVLGRANRLLVRRVDGIATSFSETAGLPPRIRAHVEHTGNPVRSAVAELSNSRFSTPKADGPFSLLVFGGSQGAAIFGEVVPQALAMLPAPLRQRLRVVQQCRETHLDSVRRVYADANISAHLATFFDDMPSHIAAAQLVIARAGASTIAELTVAGRPAILVPYPFSADHHQKANADAVEAAQGGWVVPQSAFTPEMLAARLETFLRIGECLARAARSARLMGKPDATARLADFAERLMDENLPVRGPTRLTEIAA
jgi:UDP-N-acetylglucosamine--N-acetylmuramyl-(pentapeptide) pyrophosphoryl-undecaprenol N-acetylglucosamine transferase